MQKKYSLIYGDWDLVVTLFEELSALHRSKAPTHSTHSHSHSSLNTSHNKKKTFEKRLAC